MNQRLTRRQFGRLAIAGTAAGAIATLASKTFAQVPKLTIVGVRPGALTSTNTTAKPEVDSTEVDTTEVNKTTAPIDRELDLLSLDLVTGTVQSLTSLQKLSAESTPVLQSGEQLTALTTLADGTFVVAITPISTSNQGENPTRLTFTGTLPRTVTVSGLTKQEQIESLLLLNDGSLIGLVVRKDGTPPVRLITINPKTGEIISKDRISLPEKQRFSNLAQCPDGKLYTTLVERDGKTNLVQLDLAQNKLIQRAQLSLNDVVWIGGLSSLVCSATGQLIAFGNRWHETPKYVHTLDAKTGKMTRLKALDVAKITLSGVTLSGLLG